MPSRNFLVVDFWIKNIHEIGKFQNIPKSISLLKNVVFLLFFLSARQQFQE